MLASMFGAFNKRGRRGVIGLIAAYALVLQAFLSYSVVPLAASADSPDSGSFFVLCAHDNGSAPNDTGSPVQPVAHCPICTLAASSAAIVPNPAAMPLRRDGAVQLLSLVSAQAGISFHRARAGLSRAPPTNA
jgi:hypothetical protein